ncbi:MBOAT family O-acyltransferase [Aromatoleum petrolei]|uniref:Probable alginate O-acetylase AlgI n=1 Tax=Aromatoleum petrolei TaxID=76116 RepID=A0ABX1MGU3_9RHOO|nr:MBOAT family O-acyltransferase [Aromatoleum petrolei]NMF87003.1 MBOAT family protein [Aromatoleum petrolei]QTQ37598.1 Membrane bound O-acyl transferase family protein [Aromatoleum petrolei]
MSFQSLHFLLFLCAAFALNRHFLRRPDARKNVLLAASYYFYMCWDWRYAGLLLLMSAVNFVAGRRIHDSADARARKLWLAFALGVSLGVLACFKYANFFIDSAARLAASFGFEADLPVLQLLLPVGISFFTFQSLSYTLDIFRGRERPTDSFRDFALFVAFFPTVLSGPITRARQFLPQLEQPLPDSRERAEEGLVLILRGFVKKMAFADVLAVHLVNPAFASPADYSPLFLLVAVYAFSFQLYMDLSGYTDIARGVAKLLGFELPTNFDRPYRATSVSNFWQRWHTSMSGFFRDYLYFGIGGSQRGNVYVNLYVTFIAIGCWHGAGWNFVLYGVIHGSCVCFDRWRRGRRAARGLPAEPQGLAARLVAMFVTFHIVALSRILFRAPDLDGAAAYVAAMLQPVSAVPAAPFTAVGIATLLLAALLHTLPPRLFEHAARGYLRAPVVLQGGALAGLALVLLAFSSGGASFIYFQF